MGDTIPDRNLFMMCERLNRDALRDLPEGYHARHCRKDELDIWKAMPFDDPVTAEQYRPFMNEFFDHVYAGKGDLFYESCLFVCGKDDKPIGTGFVWKIYDAFQTVHWFKVLQEHEGKGIGRALLAIVMARLDAAEYPVYLHTQPGSYRAIKLYSDFGFKLLSDPVVGRRTNDLQECLPILERHMQPQWFKNLQITQAPAYFLQKLAAVSDDQF